MTPPIKALRPFVPARDFALSKRFYSALNFTVSHEDDNVVVFDQGGFGFLLQNFYEKALADNFMVQLVVDDLDAWWSSLDPDRLVADFAVRPPRAPALQSWGLKVGFLWDPSGVLWHLTAS